MNKFLSAPIIINSREFFWINQPVHFSFEKDVLTIDTSPETDFWQRTYYGFRSDTAHALVTERKGDFTFSIKTDFKSKTLYDQCGIVLYQNNDNWIKASVEYENSDFSRLGSVGTNLGYSDWATTDISSSISTMWYRLSRIGQDFLIENSTDGAKYSQLRMLHMHLPLVDARIGIYACSPGKSGFRAKFSEFSIGSCGWAGPVSS
ncbi:MAG: DUF1349 domain-containing protein [Bacteroidales bacterium]|nr:DUF1349 domain-containing protein [Bacteroidales bacterium]